MRRPKKAKRTLTPALLGLADNVKLSTTHANTRDSYKIVEDYVLGYYVVGGTHAPVRIAPIYRASIYYKHKKTLHVASSHEIGAYFNETRPDDEEPDVDGDALAYLAATALNALERHADREKIAKKPRERRGR